MDHKELKQKAYESRSKPNRHRGKGVKYIQKSRNAPLLKHDKQRSWRRFEKREVNRNHRKEVKKDMNNQNYTCYHRCERVKQINYPNWKW